jgi:hypothetical protein
VDEIFVRPKAIDGVTTTVAGFVGPARFGPVHLAATRLGNLADFERLHGDGAPLDWDTGPRCNFLWHSVRAFFAEGGRQLHVARVFRPMTGPDGDSGDAGYAPPPASLALDTAQPSNGLYQQDGHARLRLGPSGRGLLLRARFPGAAGNLHLRFRLTFQTPTLAGLPGQLQLAGLRTGSLVWLGNRLVGPAGVLLVAVPTADGRNWGFSSTGLPEDAQVWLNPPSLGPVNAPSLNLRLHTLRILDLGLEILGQEGSLQAWTGMTLQPGNTDGLLERFSPGPGSLLPLELLPAADQGSPSALFRLLFNGDSLSVPLPGRGMLSSDFVLSGGNDGQEPAAKDYQGSHTDTLVSGLSALGEIRDLSLVAAPGSSLAASAGSQLPKLVAQYLIQHATLSHYRIALLDAPPGQGVSALQGYRSGLESSFAALYCPWVQVQDPAGDQPLLLPPSGLVAGLIVRNDIERGVAKAPANLALSLAIGLDSALTEDDQELLNPQGINCIRAFNGRGILLSGARLLSSDPGWKYLNLRRYLLYLERSIDLGTQWVVFEPNRPQLWVSVFTSIQAFLYKEWRQGNLLGSKPNEAFFVRCDRSTMAQADLAAGRLICQIGVAALKPAEFVLSRITQQTAGPS